MKTTIDIPESLYTTLAAASSAEGLSVADFVLKAASDRVKDALTETSSGKLLREHPLAEFYREVDGRSDEERRAIHEAVTEVQAIIDEEFSKIDPRDWE